MCVLSDLVGELTLVFQTLRNESSSFLSNERLRAETKVMYTGDPSDLNLFTVRWEQVVLDEGHAARTEGHLLRAVGALRDRCRFFILATATPLFNGARVSHSRLSDLVRQF